MDLEEALRRLALERLMHANLAFGPRIQSSPWRLERRWMVANRLADLEVRQRSAGTEISLENVADLAARLEAVPAVPRYTFRHIFWRLDDSGRQGTVTEVRARAADVAARAQSGEDFEALVREVSQSSDREQGGLLQNVRPGSLDPVIARVLPGLREGEVAGPIESRTGVHLVKLERVVVPAAAPREELERGARAQLQTEGGREARRRALAEARESIDASVEDYPWVVGESRLEEEQVQGMLARAGGDTPEVRTKLLELLLLAESARRRGLATAALDHQISTSLEAKAAMQIYREELAAFVAEELPGLPEAELRNLYDAQPSRYATVEIANVELIFVKQGPDSFATLGPLEDLVRELRAGSSFADVAKRLSAGPDAEAGGDLGPLPPREWARLSPEIYKVVSKLADDEISDPIYCTDRLMTQDPRTLRGGFAIVRVRERQPPRERRFEEALDDLRAVYAQTIAAELEDRFRRRLLSRAGFRIVRVPDPSEFQGS